jgi:glycerophosphoryl diester phosphodiesterase
MNIPKIFGHRGASALEPENTMKAFTRAFKDGADGIEFDVRQTADGKIVVIHDATINRTSNGTGLVKNYSYDVLLQFDFGKKERIPLLNEVLQKFGKNYVLNIEIKEPGFEKQLVIMVQELEIKENVIVSSFKKSVLKKIKELDSSLSTAYIFNLRKINLGKIVKQIKIDAIHPSMHLVTTNLVKKSQLLNLPIRTWTVDDPQKALSLAKLGVNSIITNNPYQIIQNLTKK